MNSSSRRFLLPGRLVRWVLLALAICALAFGVPCVVNTCIEKEYGPSAVRVSGVFEPGGTVKFNIRPSERSIGGHYHGTIRIEPMLRANMGEKGVIWPIVEEKLSGGWVTPTASSGRFGEFLAIKDEPTRRIDDFDIYLGIPDNPLLCGQMVSIDISLSIEYPSKVGEKSYHIVVGGLHETIEVFIKPKSK